MRKYNNNLEMFAKVSKKHYLEVFYKYSSNVMDLIIKYTNFSSFESSLRVSSTKSTNTKSF